MENACSQLGIATAAKVSVSSCWFHCWNAFI